VSDHDNRAVWGDTYEPLPGDDCRVRVLLQMANEEDASADTWRPDSEKYSEHRARAHNLREAARHIRELEAQVAAFREPAEAVGYTVSEDGKCCTGNGGGREFFQGPPIDITHGEDPGDYLEDLRAGKEPGMDHLQQADVLSRVDQVNEKSVASAIIALAHATIAEAELMVEHLRFVAESVALQRQGVDDRQQADAALMELATREPPPHIRYGAEVLNAGWKWRCERSTVVAWGDTPAEACAAFDRLWLTGSAEEASE
jgi:hypothetical protein